MMKSLLIGLDGSDDSQSAVELGLRWAKQFDAVLVGLGVVDEPGIFLSETSLLGGRGSHYWRTAQPTDLLYGARRHVSEILERFVSDCAAAGVECKTLEDLGAPFVQILMEAQRYDLVLLGQKTHFDYGSRNEPDETLRKVLQDSPRPVVVVPNHPRGGEAVVIAYDGSLQASRTVYAFVASGLGLSRSVHVVCIAPRCNSNDNHADWAADYLRLHRINASAHALESASPTAEVLLTTAREFNAGLIVMGAYGQPVLREFFLGSVTRTVLEKSPVPVFCYH